MMRTRTWIGLATVCAAAFASYKGGFLYYDCMGSLTYILHWVEFKLDKLLDHHGIFVSPHDIAKDRRVVVHDGLRMISLRALADRLQ